MSIYSILSCSYIKKCKLCLLTPSELSLAYSIAHLYGCLLLLFQAISIQCFLAELCELFLVQKLSLKQMVVLVNHFFPPRLIHTIFLKWLCGRAIVTSFFLLACVVPFVIYLTYNICWKCLQQPTWVFKCHADRRVWTPICQVQMQLFPETKGSI